MTENVLVLIGARFLQGVSGGAMLVCQIAILSHQFRTARERGMAFGWWGIISGVGLGFGPIVGGAFGDAFSVLGASIGMIKSGVGAFGILASLAIFLPLCLQAAVWLGVCFLSSLAAELFSLSKLAAFLDGCATALKLLLAVIFSIGAVSVVSAAVVLCVRGAYA